MVWISIVKIQHRMVEVPIHLSAHFQLCPPGGPGADDDGLGETQQGAKFLAVIEFVLKAMGPCMEMRDTGSRQSVN